MRDDRYLGGHNPPNTTLPHRAVEKVQSLVCIIDGLPPIPTKLDKRIEEGQFIEMAELVPERLSSLDSLNDEQSIHQHCRVATMLWDLHCYDLPC